MSSLGNHGDGHPDNTRTPLVVWGKGVRPREDWEEPANHDEYSKDWGLNGVRRDVEQADVAPLMVRDLLISTSGYNEELMGIVRLSSRPWRGWRFQQIRQVELLSITSMGLPLSERERRSQTRINSWQRLKRRAVRILHTVVEKGDPILTSFRLLLQSSNVTILYRFDLFPSSSIHRRLVHSHPSHTERGSMASSMREDTSRRRRIVSSSSTYLYVPLLTFESTLPVSILLL